MKHNSKSISLIILTTPLLAGAATITYDFEGTNGNEASISGSGVGATVLTGEIDSGSGYNALPFPGNTNEGVSELRQGTSLATSTIISSVIGTIDGQRLDGSNVTNPSAASLASYLDFTLSPSAGEALDFSGASFSLSIGAFSAVDGQSITNYTQLMYQISSNPTWVALDSVKSATFDGSVSGDPIFHTQPGGTTLFQGYSTDGEEAGAGNGGLTSVSMNVSSLSLAVDETVRFGLFMDSNVTNGAQGGVLFDDIEIANVVSAPVIPEPGTTALALLSLCSLALRRRVR